MGISSTLFFQISCSGLFELRLSSFKNELGRDSLDHCCSGYRTSSGKCSGVCRTSFRVCLKHFQNNIDPKPPCTYGDIITPVLANNSVQFVDSNHNNKRIITGFTNPIVFPFEFSWPGTFSLIIEAWHELSESEYSQRSFQGEKKVLITRLATRRWLNVSDDWTSGSHTTNYTDLEYDYRVKCDGHYYGDNCADLCRARNDSFGHYTCSDKGEKVCLPGWEGAYCSKEGSKSNICILILQPSALQSAIVSMGIVKNPTSACKCRMGWQGRSCNECIRYPGCSHGTCDQPWQCNCDEGWGGLFCNQDLNYCTNHKPCKNGGTCTNTGQGSYTCSCPEGFTGTDCEVRLDDCSHQTCRNGATCVSSETNYTCTCAVGFHGRHCEISSASTCSKNPCQNQGTCLDRAGGYRCLCHTGFSGINCEMQRDDCHPNPCVNGGSCVSRPHGFKCICPAGYNGMFCEKNINDCAKTTCMNGGTCIDSINSFKCLCVPGYMGSLCQTNVNDCLTKPCANGGLCHDLVNDYKCTCRPGFTGKDCSINIDECASNPCQHGGTCEDRVDEFVCHCLNGYIGSRCELSDGTTYVRLDANRPQVTKRVVDVSRRVSEEQERKPANTQVILISTLACVVPLLILVCLIVICMFKARRRREREVKDAEDAQIQNEQNLVNSKNNKLKDNHQIINTLDRPSGKMLKINNEDSNSLYNKDCNTIPSNVQRISKLLNIDSTSTSNKIHNDSVSVRTPSIDSSSFHNNKQNSLSSSSTTNSHRNLSMIIDVNLDGRIVKRDFFFSCSDSAKVHHSHQKVLSDDTSSSVYVIDEHFSPISKPELSTQTKDLFFFAIIYFSNKIEENKKVIEDDIYYILRYKRHNVATVSNKVLSRIDYFYKKIMNFFIYKLCVRNEGESDRLEKQWVCLESCSRMTNGESSGHFGQLGKVNEAVNVPTFI
ncbi:Neurogenic locus protein delta [Nymphon striatum]|nr:Neurogenic locus protein delta [Nymphon striatum]